MPELKAQVLQFWLLWLQVTSKEMPPKRVVVPVPGAQLAKGSSLGH